MKGMKCPRIIAPSEIAADVAIKLSIRDGISQNDTLVAFIRSNTFRRVLEDESMCEFEEYCRNLVGTYYPCTDVGS